MKKLLVLTFALSLCSGNAFAQAERIGSVGTTLSDSSVDTWLGATGASTGVPTRAADGTYSLGELGAAAAAGSTTQMQYNNEDVLAGTALLTVGTNALSQGLTTFTAKPTFVTVGTTTASINIPVGTQAPTSPVSGDVWVTDGMYVQVGTTTQGPLGVGGSMTYPSGDGIPLVVSGASWGTTIALGTSTSTYLRNDGTFAVPPGTGQWTTATNDIYYTTGNVGIGTTTIGSALTVSGNASVSTISVTSPTPTADHTANGQKASVTVDTNATGLYSCLLLASDGHYDEAKADSASTMPCSALALETSTGTKNVLLNGYARDDSWTWTIGGLVYVSAGTAGNITQTAPSTTGNQVQIIGIARSATVIEFNPNLILVEVP